MIAPWAKQELQDIDLGDKRLNRRARIIATQFAKIGESCPDAANGPTTKNLDALYRFARNEKVNPDTVLQPHFDSTIARTADHSIVHLVQDTSEIELTKPERQVQGAGPLSCNSRRGFYIHPLVAYDDKGIPLGLVAHHQWVREEIDESRSRQERKKERRSLPIEDKESSRWLTMIQRGKEIAAQNPDTHYIGLADSESDINEVLSEASCKPDNYDLLVRGYHKRTIVDCEIDGERRACGTLEEALSQAPVRLGSKAHVSARVAKIPGETRGRRASRESREAKLEIRAMTVRLRTKHASSTTCDASDSDEPMTLSVVEVRELEAPEGAEPIHWILLTTLPVETTEQIVQVIESYKLRWQIEIYFFVLKSGMRIEKMKYRNIDRYLNASALLLIAAWRVQQTTQAGRHDSEASCEKYFTADEWQSVWLISHEGDTLPACPPAMGEFLHLVATLGGYINRKQQGPPGCRTVWRGIRRLETLSQAYRVFGPRARKTCGL